jgi:proline racemase
MTAAVETTLGVPRESVWVIIRELPATSWAEGGITIAELTAPPTNPKAVAKNAVIVSTGELDWRKPATWTGALDRSPCGTGTCARMATLYAKGKLRLGDPFPHEGILGTIFTGCLLRETQVGPYKAVVPTLSGTAWITGFAQYVVDSEDPFPEGFVVGDIWGAATEKPLKRVEH